MTIYIPLLYICMGLNCGFFQSQDYTSDEQGCLQEIEQKRKEYASESVKIEAICVDVSINFERKKDESERKLQPARNVQIRDSHANGFR